MKDGRIRIRNGCKQVHKKHQQFTARRCLMRVTRSPDISPRYNKAVPLETIRETNINSAYCIYSPRQHGVKLNYTIIQYLQGC